MKTSVEDFRLSRVAHAARLACLYWRWYHVFTSRNWANLIADWRTP